MDGTRELRGRIDELERSCARVVAAADAELRRIEREIHDGVQQHLVALAVNLQLLRQLGESDRVAATALLDDIARDVRDALESVRELAHGVYPPLLLDRGLAEALRSAASAVGVPTHVEATTDRYPDEAEAAAYFCCLEALRNVADHAGSGAHASVHVWPERDEILLEVSDDGVGFEPTVVPRGAGLNRAGDRLAALGGRLNLSSAPGTGTRVSGTIPLAR